MKVRMKIFFNNNTEIFSNIKNEIFFIITTLKYFSQLKH